MTRRPLPLVERQQDAFCHRVNRLPGQIERTRAKLARLEALAREWRLPV